MTKKIFVLALLLAPLFFAQSFAAKKDAEARKVLDSTAARINKAGGISLRFTATTLVGKAEQGRVSGTMDILRKRFVLSTPETKSWFDGKTQWTLQTDDEEVAMTEPTGAELQAINPYAFIEIYKQGFNYKMKRGKLINGQTGYKIFMTADNGKQEIREIYLEIDEKFHPVRVSMRQGRNNWVRIVVTNFSTGQKFPDKHFAFPQNEYPNVEIIDLR